MSTTSADCICPDAITKNTGCLSKFLSGSCWESFSGGTDTFFLEGCLDFTSGEASGWSSASGVAGTASGGMGSAIFPTVARQLGGGKKDEGVGGM